MEFESFNSELHFGKRCLMQVDSDSDSFKSGKIAVYNSAEIVVGYLELSKAGYSAIRRGEKLKTKSVNQFRKSIK